MVTFWRLSLCSSSQFFLVREGHTVKSWALRSRLGILTACISCLWRRSHQNPRVQTFIQWIAISLKLTMEMLLSAFVLFEIPHSDSNLKHNFQQTFILYHNVTCHGNDKADKDTNIVKNNNRWEDMQRRRVYICVWHKLTAIMVYRR